MLNRYEMESVMRSAYYTVIEMLGIEDGTEPELVLTDTMKDKDLLGYHSRTKNIIVVKVTDDIEKMVETLCHELRHAWQFRRYGSYYIRTYEELDQDNASDYWDCEFEVDAREYAEANYKEVYEIAMENNSYLFE